MAVITIAREMGSEGDVLGLELADTLGYAFLNKEIIHRVADRMGSSDEEIEQYDEKTDNWLIRILTQTFASHPDMAAYYSTFAYVEPTYVYGVAEPYVYYQVPPGRTKEVDPEKVRKNFEAIIREAAAKGNIVIVGRASQCILKDMPGAFHLRTVAPLDWRIRNVVRDNPDLSNEDAAELINRNDKWRERYLAVNYREDWHNPLLYHAILSMDKWNRAKLLDFVKCGA